MKRRYVILFILVTVLLLGTNFTSIMYYGVQMGDKNEELEEAYALILSQEEEIKQLKDTEKKYNLLIEENKELAQSQKVLEEKNQSLLQTYQSLTAQFETLKQNSQELEQKLTEMDQVMKEYDYIFEYDPVTMEEYQVYIQELEDRILESGGFDKYEQPKRWKDYGNAVIWLEDGASDKWADQVIEYLNYLPNNMIQELNENGWMVIVTPRSLEDVYESGVTNTVGLTVYYRARIYLQNNSFSIDYCTIHEIGHALDFIQNFISYSEEWTEIYEKEAKNSGLAKYFTSSSSEYFAETFQSCFLSPDKVKEKAPLSYEYMMKFIEQYK